MVLAAASAELPTSLKYAHGARASASDPVIAYPVLVVTVTLGVFPAESISVTNVPVAVSQTVNVKAVEVRAAGVMSPYDVASRAQITDDVVPPEAIVTDSTMGFVYISHFSYVLSPTTFPQSTAHTRRVLITFTASGGTCESVPPVDHATRCRAWSRTSCPIDDHSYGSVTIVMLVCLQPVAVALNPMVSALRSACAKSI